MTTGNGDPLCSAPALALIGPAASSPRLRYLRPWTRCPPPRRTVRSLAGVRRRTARRARPISRFDSTFAPTFAGACASAVFWLRLATTCWPCRRRRHRTVLFAVSGPLRASAATTRIT